MIDVRRLCIVVVILISTPAHAADDAAELARKLQNPVAALFSVPLQSNLDFGAGPSGDGTHLQVDIQPVIPIALDKAWNVIWRTVLPVVYQDRVIDSGSEGGLGDAVLSLFLSPATSSAHGWTWGAGPVFLLPTATDDNLGTGKWGIGPTAVLLRQEGGWTYGLLANQIWSFAGDTARHEVSSLFLQPFLSYTTTTRTTFHVDSESTLDWKNSQWTVPINLDVAQLLRFGAWPVQVQAGYRHYLDKPSNGPDWGLRFTVTFLLPT